MTIRNSFPDVRPALNLDFANTKRLDPRITFTRSSTGTYVDEFGVIKTAASNEARFDHDSDGNSLGLLIEEERTNLIQDSAFQNSSYWTVPGTAPTYNNSVAPDGTTTAVLIPAGNNVIYRVFSVSTTHTFSVWVKSASAGVHGTSRIYCSVSQASPSAYQEFTTTDVWQKISVTRPGTGSSDQVYCQIGQWGNLNGPTQDILIWGAQFEAGSFPTSYIPTSGSTATRSADVASMTGTNFSSWYNQSEGTVLSSYLGGLSNTQTAVGIDDNTSSNQLNLYGDNGTGYCTVVTGGAVVANLTLGTLLSSTSNAICVAYKANDFASLINSGNVLTDTSGALPVVTQLRIGNSQGSSRLTGTISRLTYYDRRLTDAQLQALTL